MPVIRLFVIDVDGTLLTPEKVLTDRAVEAVRRLKDAQVQVALTSGRPPRGMRMLIEPLQLTTPLCAFNGAMFVKPDLSVIEERTLPPAAARQALELMKTHGLDVWVYRGADWYITNPNAPHVDVEERTVRFAPTVVKDLDGVLDGAVKIVGVSDDLAGLARCEAEARRLGDVSAARSQPYYLDVTHPDANKGAVVRYLSRVLGVPRAEIATIGDMPNDVAMFRCSRFSIAMGNASRAVQQQATHVTASNTEEGFARAVDELVLPEAMHTRVAKRGRAHVVVVGAGFAGMLAAQGLRDEPVRITIVDRRRRHVFQPLLYQVATASLEPDEISHPIPAIFEGQENASALLGDVERIDLGERLVVLSDGVELTYDYLVLAAGAEPAYFGHDDWSGFAPGLKTLDDALDVRRRVLLSLERAAREADERRRKELLTFVIVGGGPTGVELAGALAELLHGALRREFRGIPPDDVRVVLLQSGPAVLPTFPAVLQRKAARHLQELGVDVRFSTRADAIDARGVIAAGERIDADTVLWAAGVEGSPLAASLGAPLDHKGRVLVTPTLNVPDHPEAFVVGDLAALTQAGRPIQGVAMAAMQEGRYVARALRRLVAGEPVTETFRFRDKGALATIGRGDAVASLPGGIRLSGKAGWIVWMSVHVFYLIGFRNRFAVMLEWAWSYVTRRSGHLLAPARSAPARILRALRLRRPARLGK